MMPAQSKEETYISLSQIAKNTGINHGTLHYRSTRGKFGEQPRTMKYNGVRLIELNCAIEMLKWFSMMAFRKKYVNTAKVEVEIQRLKGMSGYDPALH